MADRVATSASEATRSRSDGELDCPRENHVDVSAENRLGQTSAIYIRTDGAAISYMRIVHLALGRAVMRGESRNEVAPFKAEPNALVRSLGTVDTKSPEAHPGGSAKRDVETVRAVIMLAFSGQAREEQPEQADEPEGREAYDYRSYLTNSGIGLNTLGAIWIGHTLTTREEVIQRRSRDDPNVHRVSSTN